MAANAWVFTNNALTKIANSTFDLDGGSYKVSLHTSGATLSTSTTTFAGVGGEVTWSGYTAGGVATAITISGTPPKIDFTTDPSWTPGTNVTNIRYAVIYEVGGDVVAYSLLDNTPADISVSSGILFTVVAHSTNGVAILTQA